MAQHKSAIKRIRQDEKKRLRNKSYKSKLKTETKKFLTLETKEKAEPQLRVIESILDRLAIKRIIHPKNAAHKKSQLARSLAKLA